MVFGDKVYCSRVEGEFAGALREQALLERKDLSAAQVMRLHSLFALPRHVEVHRRQRARRATSRTTARTRRCGRPALTPRPDGGVTLTFFATPVMSVAPARWSVAIWRNHASGGQ